MLKCPFCQFNNEDGALFCEQCKSDLGTGSVIAPAQPVAAFPAEVVPIAGFVEQPVFQATPAAAVAVAEAKAVAAPLAAKPMGSSRPVFGSRCLGKPRGSSPPARQRAVAYSTQA